MVIGTICSLSLLSKFISPWKWAVCNNMFIWKQNNMLLHCCFALGSCSCWFMPDKFWKRQFKASHRGFPAEEGHSCNCVCWDMLGYMTDMTCTDTVKNMIKHVNLGWLSWSDMFFPGFRAWWSWWKPTRVHAVRGIPVRQTWKLDEAIQYLRDWEINIVTWQWK